IVLDLEDAVAPAGKGDARAALGAAARSLRSAGKRVMVRINTEGQGYDGRDLQAALDAPLDELLLPKVEREEALQAVEERIGRSAHAATLRLVLLVETARGLRDLPALLAAPARPRRATLGMADLCRDLGIDWISAVRDEPPLFVDEVTRLRVLSRACGCEPPLGCVYPLIDDEAGLRRNATLEARLGYAGKFVIHPRQIDVVESVFRPTSAEVARARAIVEAFERAQRAGAGAVQVEGLMVDEPVARAAYALLERAGT
ncbi:MAG TPA: CoA ester lyase, partial [Candidatus Baltobacteraceae bacterium]|nr:CoA ester lyase [Candidatus Baltobacteraceae bacterium]